MDHNTATNDDDVVSISTGDGGRRGSIAERRAAKCGFKAERINTARFRTTSPLASPSVRSPCLTIPPGISPTALLDSPILLPNSQPSPTTGTFPFPLLNHESSMLNTVNPADGDKGSDVGSSFRFKSFGYLDSLPVFSSLENQVSSPFGLAQRADVNSQGLLSVEPPTDFEFPAQFSKATTNACALDSVADVKGLNNMIVNDTRGDLQMCCSDLASDQTSLHKEPIQVEDVGTRHLLEGDQKGTCLPMVTVRTSEDGYNWRKYGQKQVKGSEYPRSYYKCTHPNCQVKKKVERSHDGQITEIIYKGVHNHQKPQPSRRASLGSAFPLDEMSEKCEGSGTCVKVEGGSVWRNIQNGSKDVKLGSEWRADGLERTSSTSVVTEVSDPLSTTQGKSMGVFESAETPEFSSTLANHDDNDDDGATQGSISLGDDADDDESESKRRRIESSLIETNLASRAVRERVVVQIESEVDILDDGYRWRKYGQKVVKGNPNPRSYYKCTSPGCSVRKHVERASHNLKCVITTYEGKHNHEVPAARNSSHANSSGGNLAPAIAAQSTLTLPRTTHGPKPETQIENITPCFDRKPEFNSEYLRPSFLGNFGNEMKFGASSMYQMKFPSLQNMVPYASFGLNSNHSATQQLGSIASVVPDFPISLPWSLSPSANLSLAGINFNNNGKPIGSVQPFFSGQQLKDNETRFLRPKVEQKDDNTIVDQANASSSSYHRVTGNFSS